MKRKAYWEMTAAELEQATKQFNEPSAADRSRPLKPAERKQWTRAKRKKGRPKVGNGCTRVSVSMERGLLKRVTALAKQRRVSRSRLLAEVLELVLNGDK